MDGFSRSWLLPAFTAGALFLASGCSTARPVVQPFEDGVQSDRAAAAARGSITYARKKNIWHRYRGDGLDDDPLDPVPIALTPEVRHWIDAFNSNRRNDYFHYIRTGEKFRAVVEKTLNEDGVPIEFYYLAMIESGYRMHARSSEAAVGFWQFRKTAARRFGLQIDDYVDERKDPIRSTHAAARYLRRLWVTFNDWYLAIAAYNAGDGRVEAAIRAGGTRDFWALCDKKLLPAETRDYVPKFLAAMSIGKVKDGYGFRDPAATTKHYYPLVKAVKVPSPISLREVARAAGISYRELVRVNRHLKTELTPPNGGVYTVWLPETAVDRFEDSKKKLVAYRVERTRIVRRAKRES